MPTGTVYPHIDKMAGDPAHLKRLPRIRIAQIVMDYLSHGWSADEICRQHPYILPAEAYSALAYYFDHQDEIDQEIRSELEQSEKGNADAAPSPFYVRMKAQGHL